jgi:hypothetical protein
VIDLGARAVVILAGTNDIAGNTGPISLKEIEENFEAIAELARVHGVRVIFSSITPVHNYTPGSAENFELPITSALKSTFSFGNGASGTLAQNRELLRHRVSPISVSPADERALMDTRGLTARALGFWANANQADCGTMDPPPSVAEIAAKMQLHQPDLFLYNYTADEIGLCTALFPRLREWARNLHSAGMNNLVTIAPTPALFDDGADRAVSAAALTRPPE